MEYIFLGNSSLKISRIGFGCEPLGGHAWGIVDQTETCRALLSALDRGILLFDTADCYGLGVSEELLGRTLISRRNEAVIATKFGVRIDNTGKPFFDNSPEWLTQALDASLKRLHTDHIDLYQVHNWDKKTPIEEVLGGLEQKRVEGKIRWYGVTNINLHDMGLKALPEGLISFSLEYSLANRHHEEHILTMRRDYGLGFLSWGSLGQGILTGKYGESGSLVSNDRRNRATYVNFHGDRLKRNLKIVSLMQECLPQYPGATLAQLAIRWILEHLKFSVALVGIKNYEQLEDIVGSARLRLCSQHLELLEQASRDPLAIEARRYSISEG